MKKKAIRWLIGLPIIILVCFLVAALFFGKREWHPWINRTQTALYGDPQAYTDGMFDEVELFQDDSGHVIRKVNHTRSWEWRWTYDVNGRCVEEVRPDGRVRRWEYGEDGKVVAFLDWDGSVKSGENLQVPGPQYPDER